MRIVVLTAAICMLSACSLDYGKSVSVEDVIPEFRFTGAHFSRYEDNKQTMQIDAQRIEQYKDNGSSYAQGASFKTYDSEGNLDTEGTCELLAADTKNDIYTMFNDIFVQMYAQDLQIHAKTLRFDGNTEQLTGTHTEAVTILKKDTSITGTGFSASGVSKTFSFLNAVQGQAVTDDAQNTDEAETTEAETEEL